MCGRQFLIVENGRDFGCFGGERCWTAQSATETRDALRHARRSCVGSEGGQIEAKWTFRSAGITSRGPESGICSHLCLTSDSESPRKRVIHRQTRSESQVFLPCDRNIALFWEERTKVRHSKSSRTRSILVLYVIKQQHRTIGTHMYNFNRSIVATARHCRNGTLRHYYCRGHI